MKTLAKCISVVSCSLLCISACGSDGGVSGSEGETASPVSATSVTFDNNETLTGSTQNGGDTQSALPQNPPGSANVSVPPPDTATQPVSPEQSNLQASESLIQINPDANGDSIITSQLVGVEFVIPGQFQTGLDPVTGSVGFSDGSTLSGSVFGTTTGTRNTSETLLANRLLKPLNAEIQQVQDPQFSDSSTEVLFVVDLSGNQQYMHLDSLTGEQNNAVTIVIFSQSESAREEASSQIRAISSSVRFFAPSPPSPIVNFENQRFELGNGSSRLDNGGGSIVSEDQAVLITCADTRYSFESSNRSVTFFDGLDSSVSTGDSTSHAGIWGNGFDFAQGQNLIMQTTEGSLSTLHTQIVNGALFLGSEQYVNTGVAEDCF